MLRQCHEGQTTSYSNGVGGGLGRLSRWMRSALIQVTHVSCSQDCDEPENYFN
jgi:hypothetical protein